MQKISGTIVVLLFKWLLLILYSIGVCKGGELSESEYFFNFIRALHPENTLRIDWNHHHHHHPCSNPNQFKGVECNLAHTTIRGIRLENKNLSGRIDADSLCKLPELRVLSLARNRIRGSIPESILNCKRLIYLDLSSNLLSGRVPVALTKLTGLRKFDISNNYFKHESDDPQSVAPSPHHIDQTHVKDSNSSPFKEWTRWLPLVFGIASFFLFVAFVNARPDEMGKGKEIPRPSSLSSQSPAKVSPVKEGEEGGSSELVFFVEEEERFGLKDLLDGAAEMLSLGIYSSLYKVKLFNDDNAVFAVKRLMKLQVSSEEFGETMKKIGNLRHPNIRPLLGYSTSDDEKLLIYRYLRNGSLLTLQDNYTEGKMEFPWKLRLSIAVGIAKGLEFIYQSSDDEREIIPHGNIKPSNILLSGNDHEEPEPLISEYGYSKFQTSFLLNFQGYTAPERSSSEQADVYSFGVILLELLTGKMVEKSGLDLPKWVKSMVREEWTGEVFDKGLATDGMYAFPLLNIALKCVAHFPENRPSIAEVVEKIEEIVNAQEELSPCPSSPPTSLELS